MACETDEAWKVRRCERSGLERVRLHGDGAYDWHCEGRGRVWDVNWRCWSCSWYLWLPVRFEERLAARMRSGCAAARGSSAGDAKLIAVAVFVLYCR
jgi:hypothetical protein